MLRSGFGRVTHFMLNPLIQLYLHRSTRTRAVLIYDQKVLVVLPWIHNGTWGLPGGGVHHNEQLERGLVREVLEETSIRIRAEDLHPLFRRRITRGFLYFDVHYYCLNLKKNPKIRLQRLEMHDSKWVSLAELEHMKLERGVLEAARAALNMV